MPSPSLHRNRVSSTTKDHEEAPHQQRHNKEKQGKKQRRKHRKRYRATPRRRSQSNGRNRLKAVSLIIVTSFVLGNLYFFGILSTLDSNHMTNNVNNHPGRGLVEPTFVQSHKEECFQLPQSNATTTSKTTQKKQQRPSGIVVTVLSFDDDNAQLWNSMCTLFPSQLTHFVVPHELDVLLVLYNHDDGSKNEKFMEQELVKCMNLQPSLSPNPTIWHNMDGSILKTHNYYATTVIRDTNLTRYLEEHPIDPPMCNAPLEYIQGTRWYTGQLLHLEILKDYEYFVKLDPDIVFIEPLPFNILQDMRRRRAIFGHTGEYPPGVPTPCSNGINVAIHQYIHEDGIKTCTIPLQPIPDADRYYSNFIVGRVDFFASKGVQSLGRWLSDYPLGFFKYRWTDQFFWHVAMQLYVWEYTDRIVDYTDLRCFPIRDCWMTSLDLKLFEDKDICENGGIFVHTKHAKHWAHRWNRYHAIPPPYDLTSQELYQQNYNHDCCGTRWEGTQNKDESTTDGRIRKQRRRSPFI